MDSIAYPPTPEQGPQTAAEQQEQEIKGYFDTPRLLRVACSQPEVGINEIKLAWFICDETCGWHSRWVALTHKDIIEGVSWRGINHKGSGIPSKPAVTEAVKKALKLRLIEVQYSGGVTLYAIHRRLWIQAKLTPIWYIYNKVRYDAALEPALPEERAVISRVTDGEEMPELASSNKPVIGRLPDSYLQGNNQFLTGYQAVTSRVTETTDGASTGAVPRAPNKVSQESFNNKDFQESIRSPNGSLSHVEEKAEQREEDALQGRKRYDFKGCEEVISPASLSEADGGLACRQSAVDKGQETTEPTGTKGTKAIPVPSQTRASATARERSASPEAVTQAVDRAVDRADLALATRNIDDVEEAIFYVKRNLSRRNLGQQERDRLHDKLKLLQQAQAAHEWTEDEARAHLHDWRNEARGIENTLGGIKPKDRARYNRLQGLLTRFTYLIPAQPEPNTPASALPAVEEPQQTLVEVSAQHQQAPETDTQAIEKLPADAPAPTAPETPARRTRWTEAAPADESPQEPTHDDDAEDAEEAIAQAIEALEHDLEGLQAKLEEKRAYLHLLQADHGDLQQKELDGKLSKDEAKAARRANTNTQAECQREKEQLEAEIRQVEMQLHHYRRQRLTLVS